MKKYEINSITKEQRNSLPVGSHYFKVVFDSVEGGKDTIGYYSTYKEAVKACKDFMKEEIEYFYDSEFDVIEFVVGQKEDGSFLGKRVNAWSNDIAFKMYQYIRNGEHI